MDRVDLDRAVEDASRPSKPVSASVPAPDLNERLRLFTKLFTLYPLSATQDTEGAILAYIDETRDVPAYWLSIGLSKLVREPGRRFAPSLGEIRDAALRAIRAHRRRSAGQPEKMPGVTGDDPIRPERELSWARSAEERLLGGGTQKCLAGGA